LKQGRIAVLNIDDMLVNGEKFPIVANATKIFQNAGFRHRDRIIWEKSDGYLRISRRIGVLLQNPYFMYFYPDNLLESILIFQKGKFDYRSIPKEIRKALKIDIKEFSDNKWYMTLWEIVNVLPGSPLEKEIAAFPEELPYNRIIKIVLLCWRYFLDPFVGNGTTMKVARQLGKNSTGIEIKDTSEVIIMESIKYGDTNENS
jgi:site-specific DNA-methyltransferase (adenine-specific)